MTVTDAPVQTELDAIIANAQAIIFDWNGTLVDDAPRALAATNQVLTTYGQSGGQKSPETAARSHRVKRR